MLDWWCISERYCRLLSIMVLTRNVKFDFLSFVRDLYNEMIKLAVLLQGFTLTVDITRTKNIFLQILSLWSACNVFKTQP